jgi:hypothetical protein
MGTGSWRGIKGVRREPAFGARFRWNMANAHKKCPKLLIACDCVVLLCPMGFLQTHTHSLEGWNRHREHGCADDLQVVHIHALWIGASETGHEARTRVLA